MQVRGFREEGSSSMEESSHRRCPAQKEKEERKRTSYTALSRYLEKQTDPVLHSGGW